MKTRLISRRTVLRGSGGVAIGLPLLDIMARPRSAQAAAPKRVFFFCTMNGTIRSNWVPTGTETNFTLSPILAPLEKHKANLVILEGVDNVAATKGEGDDHMRGMGSMLSGVENAAGPTGGGISLDQHIGNATGANLKFKSLVQGVSTGGGTVLAYTSYSGKGAPIPAESNPTNVFNRVFKDFTAPGGTTTAPDPALVLAQANKKSILDAADKAYKALQPRVGKADQLKLDQHLSQIRDLEKQVALAGSGGATGAAATCKKADVPVTGDMPKNLKAQMDMAAMAFRCDLTRSINLQVSTSAGGPTYSWLGINRGHHDLSHDGDSVAESQMQLTQINAWLAGQLGYFMDLLAATPEDNGTMLDNTVILWANELAKGNNHSHPDMPYLLAGGKNLGLRVGRYLKFNGTVAHNNLLVSIMNLAGVSGSTFGNPAYGTGPLAGLV